jgi:D-proline reductase (dithiol) PrdB
MSDQAEAAGARAVDPWRFTGNFLRNVLSARIPDEPTYDAIPWTAVTKGLGESRIALLSTAGLSMKDDRPFDMEMERRNPLRGDPSWRRIRADATGATVEANHLHIDTGYIHRDLNVALPLDRLRELESGGEVGAVAESHYSIMGYQGNDTTVLEQESAPAIAETMRSEEVDLALLAPV